MSEIYTIRCLRYKVIQILNVAPALISTQEQLQYSALETYEFGA